MRCAKLGSFIAAAVCLAAASGFAVSNSSIVGTWQTTITGADQGVAFLTFANGLTFTGYGISRDSLQPFVISGTWGVNTKERIVGGYTEYLDDNTNTAWSSGTFLGNILVNGRFVARVKATGGNPRFHNFMFRAPAAAAVPLIGGSWSGIVTTAGKKTLADCTLTAVTNTPGWFDLTGTGINQGGTFTISGAVLLTSDRHAAAYTVSDFGTATTAASFYGRLTANGKRLILTGQDEHNKHVVLRATKR